MKASFIGFFSTILILCGIIITLVRSSLSYVFPRHNGTTTIILLVCALGFIGSVVLARYFESSLMRIVYIFFTTLAGLLWYMFLVSIVVIIVRWFIFVGLLPSSLSIWLSIATIAIPLVLSATGIIQSFLIRTQNYTIDNNDLRGKRIVMMSDLHIGIVNQGNFVDRISNRIAQINTEKPIDMIIVAGDLFDGQHMSGDISNNLSQISGISKTVFAPGNHEGYGPTDEFYSIISDAGISLLRDQSETINGITVLGLDYRNRQRVSEIQNIIQNNSDADVVINHEPIGRDILNEFKIPLSVSGHTHNGQFWPNNFVARAVYRENTYGLVTNGISNHITSSGVGTALIKMRTFNRPEIVVIDFQ